MLQPQHCYQNQNCTSASTIDLRPPLQAHHKYGHQYQSSRFPHRKPKVAEEQFRSKSIRWTKDQLGKIDKIGHSTKDQSGSCSSSSQGTVTDDSGIHSGQTPNNSIEGSQNPSPGSSPVLQQVDKNFNFIGRSDATRRPIRKLPAVPSAKQAHIIDLTSLNNRGSDKTKVSRTLPTLPSLGNPKTSSGWLRPNRLSNFFRSVKFSRSVVLH